VGLVGGRVPGEHPPRKRVLSPFQAYERLNFEAWRDLGPMRPPPAILGGWKIICRARRVEPLSVVCSPEFDSSVCLEGIASQTPDAASRGRERRHVSVGGVVVAPRARSEPFREGVFEATLCAARSEKIEAKPTRGLA
jgi:hypothetical protein